MDKIIKIFESVRDNKIYRPDLFNKDNSYYYTLRELLREAEGIYSDLEEAEQQKVSGKLSYIRDQYERI